MAILGAGVALAGCAFGRDEIKLADTPLVVKTPVASRGRSVFVRSVTDERVFAKSGGDPATPSLGPDGDTADIKARAVSRKRNGYGMALGDVTLEPGKTVAGQVGETLRQAFQQAGYTVVNDAGATGASTPIIVDVRVKKFWTWRRKGFTVITLLSDIQTELTVTGAKSAPAAIAVHLEDEVLIAGGQDTTIESLQKALAAYRADAVIKLADMRS